MSPLSREGPWRVHCDTPPIGGVSGYTFVVGVRVRVAVSLPFRLLDSFGLYSYPSSSYLKVSTSPEICGCHCSQWKRKKHLPLCITETPVLPSFSLRPGRKRLWSQNCHRFLWHTFQSSVYCLNPFMNVVYSVYLYRLEGLFYVYLLSF